MKKILGLFLIVGASAFAASNPPPALGKIKGILVTGLNTRTAFEFEEGNPEDCERKEAGDLIFFSCVAKNVSLKLADNVRSKYTFGKYWVMFAPQKNGDVMREYRFTGNFNEAGIPDLTSPASMTVWYYTSNPTLVRGVLKVDELGISPGLQATRAAN